MRELRVVVALLAGAAGTASAQLAISQPTEKLLVLPLAAASADSAMSIALADAVRERIAQLAKYKVQVVTKAKLCEALQASGFPCDGLLDDQQARQLARFLQVQAYVTGSLERSGNALVARVRVIDIGSSGMAASFVVRNGNPGTTAEFAEQIAQRLNTIVRASEQARECTQNRQKGQFSRALSSAQKALAIDPTSAGAHLCISTVYEAQRMPVDSIIAASERALRGDSLNGTAWENIARGWQQKGDTLKAIDAFIAQLEGEPRNTSKRLGIAQLLRQMKQFQRAVDVLDDGLVVAPSDPQMIDLKNRVCIEGELWRCALTAIDQKVAADSTALEDSLLVKTAIAAAEQVADTHALVRYGRAGTRHFPKSDYFWKKRGAAFELAGMPDSAVTAYQQALALEPKDVATSLLVAKAMVDRAVYDTARAREYTARKDSLSLRALQQAFADRVDSARTYLRPGLTSSDSTQRLSAAVIMLTGGSKLAQAAAYGRALPWFDTLLQVVAPRAAADTLGPRHQVRINASFWYGLSSTLTLAQPYQAMVKNKSCDEARQVSERLNRTEGALQLGLRVHEPTARQMLGFVKQYKDQMPRVKQAYKCRNF